jgi:hypothetical protein
MGVGAILTPNGLLHFRGPNPFKTKRITLSREPGAEIFAADLLNFQTLIEKFNAFLA